MARLSRFNKGQSLIEILTAIGLTAVLLPALATGLVASRSGRVQSAQRSEAAELVREAAESLRVIRQLDWSNVVPTGTYHPASTGTSWELAPGQETILNFTRDIEISDVQRNAAGSVVASGGVVDPSTRRVDISVTWGTPLASSVTSTLYLTRYLDNLAYTETTYDQFSAGSVNGTTVTGVSGGDGEVTLGGGGHGDWCQPAITQWGFNLNHSANGTAISAVEGRAFVVTGEHNASETFYDVSITDTYPPTAVSAGVLTGQKKAYGVFGDSTYAYIATDTRQKQGTIIRLSDHQEVGWLDVESSSINGRGIVVFGNYAYLSTTDNKIYVFDITSKTGTKTPLSNVTLSATALKLVISESGSYIYAALDAASNQLAIVPITGGGASLGTPDYVSVSGQNGRDIFVNSSATRAYLAVAASVSQDEAFIINVDPASPGYRQVLAGRDTAGMDPKGITAVTNNKLIIVGSGGTEYQVYDVGTDAFVTCVTGTGMLEIDSGVRGVASVVEADGDAYAYVLTEDSSSEFKIIEGGPSGQAGTFGTFESAPYDFSVSYSPFTAVNRYLATAALPGGTSITYQFAGADAVNNNCTDPSYVYVDPNPDGTIPLDDDGAGYENPARCFRYRAEFSTNTPSSAPTLYDITINFSP